MTSSDPAPNTDSSATSEAQATPQPTPADTGTPPVAETPVSGDTPAATSENATPETAPSESEKKKPTREPALPPQPVPDVLPAPQPHDLSRIAQDLQIRKAQVEAVVQLLDDENTVPFITRYRKERTGGLNEEVIRRIQDRVASLRSLTDRKRTILKSIAGQGKLNDALTQAILAADSPKRLDDLYLPFKPKKKSLATEAREKGLGPLAEAIFNRDQAVNDLPTVVAGLVDPDKWLLNTDDVMAGVRNILAEMVSDSAEVRGPLRAFSWDTGAIVAVKGESVPETKGKEYEPYFRFREPLKDIPPHRVLAINRGEKAGVLQVRVDTDAGMAFEIATYHLNIADHPHRVLMQEVTLDAIERLIKPSLDREIRRELTDHAQEHAVMVFAKNLRSLLLQPPLRGKKVLAVDPGIRSGCKLAALDETGKLLEDAVVYPHGQKQNVTDAKRKMEQLIRKHQITVIAIGNGTGCRDTEQLVADLIADLAHRRLNPVPDAPQAATITDVPATPLAPETPVTPVVATVSAVTLDAGVAAIPTEAVTLTTDTPATLPTATGEALTAGVSAPDAVPVAPAAPVVPPAPPISLEGLPDAPEELAYVIVIEAGASDYSASPVAREEFPDLDATTRGTISIGRRLQDPLAELVKIDPQHIGVGLYQHDVKPKFLKESLEGVIESSVNQVGVELNTASVPLLRHVSGLNQLVAREIVTFRERNGAFTSREQLLQVPTLGDKRFTQAAGFLKLPDASEPLDNTWIHPESYPLARQVLEHFGFTSADLRDKAKVEELRTKFNEANLAEVAAKLGTTETALDDIFAALARPGRDPREDLPPPIFKTGVLKLEDISQGMELKGTVLNVVPFGAFVDVGLKESGLVHVSQMANRYIKSPYEVVSVGDVVTVWVMEVKSGEKKISLSMIPPGSERGKDRNERQERPAPQPRPQRPRPERTERPERPAQQPRGAGDRPGFQARTNQAQPQGQGTRYSGRGQTAPPASDTPKPAPATTQSTTPPATQSPPPAPRKPAKAKPLPNLSAEKKSGKAALNTFGELAAFFKPPEPEKKPEPPPAPEAKPEVKPEAKTDEPPKPE
jgi:transcriptional accessory protein Tex/SPT6